MLDLGDTILMTTSGSGTPHLWVIITDPRRDNGKAVMVNITTKREHSDTTVIVKPSDHPFVKHDSVINYGGAQRIDTCKIEEKIRMRDNDCVPHQKCSTWFMRRIREGLPLSRRTPNKILKYCQHAWADN